MSAGANAKLPGVLAEIAEVAGRTAAIKLALEWGGLDLHIPKPAHLERCPDHRLAALLAAEPGAAQAIAARFGGDRIYLPQARSVCALYLAGQGVSAAAIADRLLLPPRTVRRLIRRG
ncbi:MAG: hypothetical protein OXC15_14950 [Rhodospirillaceae bacterium]|nr:hypothetical protein [Rhodospirillaceae bacterium]